MLLQKSRKRHRSPTKTSAASSASSPPAASSPPVASSSAASSSSSASLPPPPPPPSPSPPPPPPSVFTEDPMFPLANFDDFVDDKLINYYRSQWSSIRTNRRSGRIQSTYNIRLTHLNTTSLHHTLWNIFKTQSSAFKINLSFGFILRNKISGEHRYFHSSKKVSGRCV